MPPHTCSRSRLMIEAEWLWPQSRFARGHSDRQRQGVLWQSGAVDTQAVNLEFSRWIRGVVEVGALPMLYPHVLGRKVSQFHGYQSRKETNMHQPKLRRTTMRSLLMFLCICFILTGCGLHNVRMATFSWSESVSNQSQDEWERIYPVIPINITELSDITVLVIGSCFVTPKTVISSAIVSTPDGPQSVSFPTNVLRPSAVRLLIDGQEISQSGNAWTGSLLGYAQHVAAGTHEVAVEWKSDEARSMFCANGTATVWQTTRN